MTETGSEETARLAALHSYRILETEPERAFDDLAILASQICDTPIAFISLVDAERQWFKSRVGLSLTETSRSVAFCSHAIEQRELFVVDDAREHHLFRDNPLVTGEPGIRFYAGAPLVNPEGHAVGTLCVVDHVPRALTSTQAEALDVLRRQAEAQLELRRNLIELERALTERDRIDADRLALIGELRASLDEIDRLGALLPYCSNCKLDVVIPARVEAISTVTDGVTQLLHHRKWPQAEVDDVELALREALANAILHGCGSDPEKQVQCLVTAEESGEVVIVVRDPGPGFDSRAVPDPRATENLPKTTGRGIFLVNHVMDEVSFRDHGRELQMRKRSGAG